MDAILGGILIGIAASLMLLLNGRVSGISGIIGGLLNPQKSDISWRVCFLLGLLIGGLTLSVHMPQSMIQKSAGTPVDFVLAGFLVGFGTLLGNGCTSGHAVCGISRFSLRSLVATMTFILFGIISVVLFRLIRGEV